MNQIARLRRLEQVEYEAVLLRYARWIEERHGQPVEETLRRMREIERRTAREGIEAQHERLAREYNKSPDEIRAAYDEVVAEFERWSAGEPA